MTLQTAAKVDTTTYASVLYRGAEKLSNWMNEHFFGDVPIVSVTLGSGLGPLVEKAEVLSELSFHDLELPNTTALGHSGKFIAGRINGEHVIMQQGRFHSYEGHPGPIVALPIRMQALAGVRTFIITNAAGGLSPDFNIGDVVVLSSNDSALAPCPSIDVEGLGAKFYPVNACYTPNLRDAFLEHADKVGIDVVDGGVYVFRPGPNYEEPSDIYELVKRREAAIADGHPEFAPATVGMSTVPEVYALRQLATRPEYSNIQSLGLSVITNLAAGIGGAVPDGDEVVEAAPLGGSKIIAILESMLDDPNSWCIRQNHQH